MATNVILLLKKTDTSNQATETDNTSQNKVFLRVLATDFCMVLA